MTKASHLPLLNAKQIGFVTDLTWLDFQKLNGIENDCKKILSSSKYIDETRCENMCYAISKRIEYDKRLVVSRITHKFFLILYFKLPLFIFYYLYILVPPIFTFL